MYITARMFVRSLLTAQLDGTSYHPLAGSQDLGSPRESLKNHHISSLLPRPPQITKSLPKVTKRHKKHKKENIGRLGCRSPTPPKTTYRLGCRSPNGTNNNDWMGCRLPKTLKSIKAPIVWAAGNQEKPKHKNKITKR